jgi:hypothetical protein
LKKNACRQVNGCSAGIHESIHIGTDSIFGSLSEEDEDDSMDEWN